jgi:hypothetical protein
MPFPLWQKCFLFYKPEPILKWIDEQECAAFHEAVDAFYAQTSESPAPTIDDSSDGEESASSEEDDDDSSDDFVAPEPHFVHLSLEQ